MAATVTVPGELELVATRTAATVRASATTAAAKMRMRFMSDLSGSMFLLTIHIDAGAP